MTEPVPTEPVPTTEPPRDRAEWLPLVRRYLSPALVFFLVCFVAAVVVGRYAGKTWSAERVTLDLQEDAKGVYYVYREKPKYVDPEAFVAYADAQLRPENLAALSAAGEDPPGVLGRPGAVEYARETLQIGGEPETVHYALTPKRHWGFWSLLPALAAVGLCWMTREPLLSLFGGVVVGAMLLARYDLTDAVLVGELATTDAATLLVLYLWLLGGLLGVWSRTGAAQAFADLMTRKFVRGPRSAKLVAWLLGVIFFQGGTISTVLVGTTVKPLADREKIAHEELSYIVDSTASPIANLLAFNAWPGYVQAFIFIAGVPFLATVDDRIAFFFKGVPFCFYSIFAVLFTFLLAIEKSPFLGRRMRTAIDRARTTGALDAPDANPLSARELQETQVPEGYAPVAWEFFLPLGLLIATAVGTFVFLGTPKVTWAFGVALLVAIASALIRGMSLADLMEGFHNGLKGVVLGSVILLLAVTIGGVSQQAGGGLYLVESLGDAVPYWALPVLLQLLAIVIAFSTGTSFGTYAVAFPLAMPLAWQVGNAAGLENVELFMTICFAAVLNGGVAGDQCSPISDTTVLSSMCTGCDLMDHVKTQLPQASIACVLAAACWTACAVWLT